MKKKPIGDIVEIKMPSYSKYNNLGESFEYMTIKLEGFDTSLDQKIPSYLCRKERSDLLKEITINYKLSMKKLGQIEEGEEVIIIDENDWKIIKNQDDAFVFANRKIICGFSTYSILKRKYLLIEKNLNEQKSKKLNEQKSKKLKKKRSQQEIKRNSSIIYSEDIHNNFVAKAFSKKDREKNTNKLLYTSSINDENSFMVNLFSHKMRRDIEITSSIIAKSIPFKMQKNPLKIISKSCCEMDTNKYSKKDSFQDKEYILLLGNTYNTSNYCQKPEIPNLVNKYALTNERQISGPLSVMFNNLTDKILFDKKLEAPIAIDKFFSHTYNMNKWAEFLTNNSYEYKDKNGVFCNIDPKINEDYKGVLGDVLKSLAVGVFTGVGLTGVNVPIRIYEPVTMLENYALCLSGLPKFMKKANEIDNNPLERMKYAVCGLISGQLLGTKQRKPFVPNLGETLQMEFEDGSTCVLEHISFDPVITRVYMDCKGGFKIWGNILAGVSLSINSFELSYLGTITIEFSDKTRLNVYMPHFKTDGFLYGERISWIINKSCFEYQDFNLKGYIEHNVFPENGKYNPKENPEMKARKDICRGYIYEIDPKNDVKMSNEHKNINKAFNVKKKKGDIKSYITGSWIHGLAFDEKEYWNKLNDIPFRFRSFENPLPSDSRFREDLIWLHHGDKIQAGFWAKAIITQQKNDLKSRNDYCKKYKVKK